MAAMRTYQPSLDTLEDRCLLAATLTVTFSAGILKVEGTPGDDIIAVKQYNSRLWVEGVPVTTSLGQVPTVSWYKVTQIQIDGLEGNDVIRLDKGANWNAVTKASYAHLGDGDDTYYGGNGFDSVWGDAGNDLVYGGAGNDWLRGHVGNDRLFGQAGADTLNAHDGDDYLNGGAGFDALNGGNGIDTFHRNIFVPGQTLAEDKLVDGPNLLTPANDNFLQVRQTVGQTSTFMAALAATAHWTGRFPLLGEVNEDLLAFISYDATTDLYGIPMFVNGQWETIAVSSDWNESFDPRQLWVTLYLKAYLKASDVTYQAIDGSYLPAAQWISTTGKPWQNASYALVTLTGQVPFWMDNIVLNPLTMSMQLNGGLKMVAMSAASVGPALLPNHAYAVLNVFQDSAGVWKVSLYNPWGKDRTGPTLDGSDDGIVTLTFAGFQANFLGYSYN